MDLLPFLHLFTLYILQRNPAAATEAMCVLIKLDIGYFAQLMCE